MFATVDNEIKIVFVGNVGSGKTTSINAISEIPVIGTEAKATEGEALHRKETTTVSMEYGMIHIDGIKLHIYGAPGQRRFDFMASILCQGSSGMLVMIDNGHENPLNELDYFLQFHSEYLKTKPAIIVVTHYDDNNTDTYLVEYHKYAMQHGFRCPVVRIDARVADQVKSVVEKLVTEILRRKAK